MGLPLRHGIGERLISVATNEFNACLSVRAEDESEELRHEIVERTARLDILMRGASGTALKIVFDAALPHPAPCRFFVLSAPGTFIFQITGTRPTVKTAVRYQSGIGNHFFHHISS